MKLKSKVLDDVMVIEISGELLGGHETDAFHKLLYQAVSDDLVKIVVDLKNVTWMNSSGLGMLVSGLTTMRSSDGDLKLANVSERVRRPLQITRLENVFEIYQSVEEAIKSFLEK